MCDIVKREKHQNRLVRPSGGVTWGAQDCVLRERFCSKSSTLTECSLSLPGRGAGKCMTSDWSVRAERLREDGEWRRDKGSAARDLSVSGSDQAREGRLVDALAARGDEGRDTLR